MNRELKEKVYQNYEKDEKLIDKTQVNMLLITLILLPIVIAILTYPICPLKSFAEFYFLIWIFDVVIIFTLSITLNIQDYLAKPFVKKRMISDIKYYNKNYRIYDGICATRNWEIKCINEDDFTYIDTNESIDFHYRIIIDGNSITITENQYETLNKIKKEYNDKYNRCNPLLLLTNEQFVALQNNSILEGEVSVV